MILTLSKTNDPFMGTTHYDHGWSDGKACGANGICIQKDRLLFSHDSKKECIRLAREYNKTFECEGSWVTKLNLLLDELEE